MASKPQLVNVIGVGELDNKSTLDLQYMAEKMEGSRLNNRKFPGLIIRKTKPKGTILLFKSNKFLIIGADSPHNCELLSLRLAKDTTKILSQPLRLKSFKISNLVASAHLGFPVNIERIAELSNAYKDDKSTGVFMRMGKVKCVVVFESGKVVLNGATQMGDVEEVYEGLVGDLEQFRLRDQERYREKKEEKKKGKGSKRQGDGEKNQRTVKKRQDKTKSKGKPKNKKKQDEPTQSQSEPEYSSQPEEASNEPSTPEQNTTQAQQHSPQIQPRRSTRKILKQKKQK